MSTLILRSQSPDAWPASERVQIAEVTPQRAHLMVLQFRT